MKTISFDVWGTLIKSNPKFKKAQGKLATQFTNGQNTTFLKDKVILKKEIDLEVESSGIHPDREFYYKKLLPDLSLREIKLFITYSDILFLKYPPIVLEKGKAMLEKFEDCNIVISSNTVFIYGDTLSKILFKYFEIPINKCNFSDKVGVSKPNEKMFNFKIKPTMHVGDNPITDSACEKFGIKFINIKDANI